MVLNIQHLIDKRRAEGNLMDYRQDNVHQQLYEQLLVLPKVELHRHLEGSLRLSTLADIARDYKMNLPGYEIDDFRHMVQITAEDKPDAQVFLSKFGTLRDFYKSPEIIDRVTFEAIADAANENIIYMELRFTPMALAREMGYSLGQVSDWVIGATKRGMAAYDIDVRLIISMNRHETVEIGMEAVQAAAARMDEGVVGVDLAGAEDQYPGEPFRKVFSYARDAGLNVTIHAGEWAGPESVREAVEVLQARRLGHGVRALEDKEILKRVCEQKIAFEICVTSNCQSGVIAGVETHPLAELFRLCPNNTTINTDDPSVSAINLTDEMVVAMESLGFSTADVKQQIMNAANAAFLSDTERAALVKRLWTALYESDTRKQQAQSQS